jgi:DNA repair protein RadA/Sms
MEGQDSAPDNSAQSADSGLPYYCGECFFESQTPRVRCPSCHKLATIVRAGQSPDLRGTEHPREHTSSPKIISSVRVPVFERVVIDLEGMPELLGGGAVRGHVGMIGGKPSSGKTTLAIQMLDRAQCARALFISAELPEVKVAQYTERVGANARRIEVVECTDTDEIERHVRHSAADVVVVDSISELSSRRVKGQAGDPLQVRLAMETLLRTASFHRRAIFVITHVNAEGRMVGPMRIQHGAQLLMMVHRKQGPFRLVRSHKSQQGPDNVRAWYRVDERGRLVPSPPPVQYRDDVSRTARRKRALDDSADGAGRRARAPRRTDRTPQRG